MRVLLHNSKKMRTAAIIIGALMLIVAILFRISTQTTPSSPKMDTSTTTTSSILDSDNDGYLDWQELLYNSDPNDPKSTPETSVRSTSSESGAETSATDSLAQSLLSKYLSSSNGGSSSINNTAELGAQIAVSLQEPNIPYEVVLAKDLKTTSSSQASYVEYEKSLKEAIRPISKVSEAEIATYGRLIAGDKDADAEMSNTILMYKEAAKNVQKINPPEDALAVHVGLINALGYYSATLETMRTNLDDSIESILLLRVYNEAERNVFDSFEILNKHLEDHK